LTPDLKRAENFTLKMIFGFFFLNPRKDQIKNLEDVNLILLALPENNDVDVVSSVSFGVLDYRESPCLSHLEYLIIVSLLPLTSGVLDYRESFVSHIWGA